MIFCLLQLQHVKAEISEASKNPQGLLSEAIHSAGFSGALANPLLAPESALNRLNSTILEEYVAVCLRKLCIWFENLFHMKNTSFYNEMTGGFSNSCILKVSVFILENFRNIIMLLGWCLRLLVSNMRSC